jgi:hypothetical protein
MQKTRGKKSRDKGPLNSIYLHKIHGAEFFLNAWNLNSVAEPEPHHIVRAGAGAVMRCGSGSDNGIKHD